MVSIDDVRTRIKPVYRLLIEVIYGRYSQGKEYHLADLPEPYEGWIDFLDKKHYCTIFDLQSEPGRELREKFWNSSEDNQTYDFKPTDSFQVKGKLVAKGEINDLEWVVLQTE